MRFARCFIIWLVPVLLSAQASPCKSTVTGDLAITPFTSKTFGTTGFVSVWLPPGYNSTENASRRYPVLYMFDGQILFDDCRGGVPEWHVDETLTRLIQNRSIEPLIVVGIDAGRGQRMHEFLPYKDTVFSPASPEPAGKQFPGFLATEIVPFVVGKYRVTSGPQAIGGASYGGIAALYALLARPDLFALGLIESPSLAVGNGQMLRDTEHLFKGPSRVYLGMGGLESGGSPDSAENRGYIAMIHTLEQNLKAITTDPPAVLTLIQPDGKHLPAAWATRFERAIEFLYPGK